VIEDDILNSPGFTKQPKTKLAEAETRAGDKIYRTFSANRSCGFYSDKIMSCADETVVCEKRAYS